MILHVITEVYGLSHPTVRVYKTASEANSFMYEMADLYREAGCTVTWMGGDLLIKYRNDDTRRAFFHNHTLMGE